MILMSKFEESEWAQENHAKEFVDYADIYVLERKRLFKILKSFYRHFLVNNKFNRPIKVLDLGCGNGALTKEILNVSDDEIEVTLVDGSSQMLETARENLKSYDLNFVHKTFQELLENESQEDGFLTVDFDFVISSLAIHHLYTEEKKALFKYIHNHLNLGGYFLNIETIKAPTDELESWYRVLWSEWIEENEVKMKLANEWPDTTMSFANIPEKYKNNPDNHPDSLKSQLNALKSVGFKQVDCYYKHGILSIYGGQK